MLQSSSRSDVVTGLIGSEHKVDATLLIRLRGIHDNRIEITFLIAAIRVVRSKVGNHRERIFLQCLRTRVCACKFLCIVKLKADVTCHTCVNLICARMIRIVACIVQTIITVTIDRFKIWRSYIAITCITLSSVGSITILTEQVAEGKRQVMLVIIRRNIENELTSTYGKVIGCKRLDKFQLFLSNRIFLTLTDNVHAVDIRIQSFQRQ